MFSFRTEVCGKCQQTGQEPQRTTTAITISGTEDKGDERPCEETGGGAVSNRGEDTTKQRQ